MDTNTLARLKLVLMVCALAVTPDAAEGTASGNVESSLVPYQMVCADRHGYLPVERFYHRSCTMCYTYLFLASKSLVSLYPFESLGFKNESMSDIAGPISPDPSNQTTMDMVCTTLSTDECRRWSTCCQAALQCCERQRGVPWPAEDEKVCSRTWDGYSCWDDAKAGTKVYTSCPSFMEKSVESRSAIKECTVNATWVKNQGLEWTDYTKCLDMEKMRGNSKMADIAKSKMATITRGETNKLQYFCTLVVLVMNNMYIPVFSAMLN